MLLFFLYSITLFLSSYFHPRHFQHSQAWSTRARTYFLQPGPLSRIGQDDSCRRGCSWCLALTRSEQIHHLETHTTMFNDNGSKTRSNHFRRVFIFVYSVFPKHSSSQTRSAALRGKVPSDTHSYHHHP